jgi:hypothetical protein
MKQMKGREEGDDRGRGLEELGLEEVEVARVLAFVGGFLRGGVVERRGRAWVGGCGAAPEVLRGGR